MNQVINTAALFTNESDADDKEINNKRSIAQFVSKGKLLIDRKEAVKWIDGSVKANIYYNGCNYFNGSRVVLAIRYSL